MKKKIVFIQARDGIKAGTRFTVVKSDPAEGQITATEAAELIAEGIAQDADSFDALATANTENAALKAAIKEDKVKVIKARVTLAKQRGAIPPKDETVQATALERLDKGADPELLVELIDGMQSKETAALAARVTKPYDASVVRASGRVEVLRNSLPDAAEGYLKASEPQHKLILNGNFKEASKLSIECASIVRDNFMPIMKAGDDVDFRDIIRAATVSDPDSQLGSLQSDMIVMRNLGFLVNKIDFWKYLTTDMRNEPATFEQVIKTRYITVPALLTYIPGVGYTRDGTTISNVGATTTQAGIQTQTSGTLTKSAPSTTDVNVTLDQHKGVEIEFPTNKLGSTMRNLFSEQYAAQMYPIAEAIAQFMLDKAFKATWTGTVTKMSLGAFNLAKMIAIKNRMTLAKIPDVGRFAILHSTYHDNLLVDSNLLSAKAILALINKDASAFEQGDVPSLFGVKPLESQLCSYTGNGAAATYTAPGIDANTGDVDFSNVDHVGFAGNHSSLVFVARVPQDYQKALEGVPATAAMAIVTEPNSGLSVLTTKYVNNEKASVSQRASLMWGGAQGDPRVGIILDK